MFGLGEGSATDGLGERVIGWGQEGSNEGGADVCPFCFFRKSIDKLNYLEWTEINSTFAISTGYVNLPRRSPEISDERRNCCRNPGAL